MSTTGTAARAAKAGDAQGGAGSGRGLSGEKAQRIVDAMRHSVAHRGIAGSTFDHVSREAGVSRGLLHYYFGTKEQLLVEAVRRDADLRLERLEEQLSTAQTADDFIDLMAQSLQETVRDDPEFITLAFELFTLARRNDDVAAEYGQLIRRSREHLAAMLDAGQQEGIIKLHAEPDAIAEVLFSLADGFALRMLSEPDRDFACGLAAGTACARALLRD
jgi:AcrR family transcriptional regulator